MLGAPSPGCRDRRLQWSAVSCRADAERWLLQSETRGSSDREIHWEKWGECEKGYTQRRGAVRKERFTGRRRDPWEMWGQCGEKLPIVQSAAAIYTKKHKMDTKKDTMIMSHTTIFSPRLNTCIGHTERHLHENTRVTL